MTATATAPTKIHPAPSPHPAGSLHPAGPPESAPSMPRVDQSPPTRRWYLGLLAVLAGAVGFGTAPIVVGRVLAAGVPPESVSVLRMGCVAIMFSPVAGKLGPWRREALWCAFGGAIGALGYTMFTRALAVGPAPAATVVYYTFPLFAIVFGAAARRRWIRPAELALAAMILAGVAISVGAEQIDAGQRNALLLAFAAPIAWALFIVILAGPAAAMPPTYKLFSGCVGGLVAGVPLVLATNGVDLMPMTGAAVGWVVLMALCCLTIPALLFNHGAAIVGETVTSVVGGVEFVIAAGLGWLVLAEPVRAAQIGGALLILAAAVIVALRPDHGATAPSHRFLLRRRQSAG